MSATCRPNSLPKVSIDADAAMPIAHSDNKADMPATIAPCAVLLPRRLAGIALLLVPLEGHGLTHIVKRLHGQ